MSARRQKRWCNPPDSHMTCAAGVSGIVTYKVPRHAVRDAFGGDEQVDGGVVQDPALRLADLLGDQVAQLLRGVHRAGDNPFEGLPRIAREDLLCAVNVQPEDLFSRDARRDGCGNDCAGGCARDKRKDVTRQLAGCLFQFYQCDRGQNAAYAATIDGEQVAFGHCYSPNNHSSKKSSNLL